MVLLAVIMMVVIMFGPRIKNNMIVKILNYHTGHFRVKQLGKYFGIHHHPGK